MLLSMSFFSVDIRSIYLRYPILIFDILEFFLVSHVPSEGSSHCRFDLKFFFILNRSSFHKIHLPHRRVLFRLSLFCIIIWKFLVHQTILTPVLPSLHHSSIFPLHFLFLTLTFLRVFGLRLSIKYSTNLKSEEGLLVTVRYSPEFLHFTALDWIS